MRAALPLSRVEGDIRNSVLQEGILVILLSAKVPGSPAPTNATDLPGLSLHDSAPSGAASSSGPDQQVAESRTDDFEAVVCATRAAVPVVADLAARRVSRRAWARQLIPDDDTRRQVLYVLAAVLAEHALGHGNVDVIGDRAAAIWLDRTVVASPGDADIRDLLGAALGRHAHALIDGLGVAAPRTHDRLPHLHLVILAAANTQDALDLLAHRHRRLDRAGVVACTDVGTSDEQAVLAAAGYRPDEAQRPSGRPQVWSMWRLPAGQRGSRSQIWPPEAG
ncbi:hypothetical protein [Actinoplanes sp. NPDC026619]|uniref:hypothetical protein n=1 Tax=Actinoplanes sp. NPDC026619 TaxID=3155798 RepID=UPI00340A7F98